MISNLERADSEFEKKIAERYSRDGFDVVVNPRSSELPFSLGNYRPDLVATKGASENYIIEVKSSHSQVPIDRYRDVAEAVSEHPGWKFLLVTDKDAVTVTADNSENQILPWTQIRESMEDSERLLNANENAAAFLLAWSVLEAVLRRRAEEMSIPVERTASSSLIKQMYSQGEISINQFDEIMGLYALRNRIAHGFQVSDLENAALSLSKLVKGLVSQWATSSPA